MSEHLTRRQLLERAGAAGAALTVPAWLAACGGRSTKGGTTSLAAGQQKLA
jgi:hypothetical protein